ncbi:MAG TPA: hypothetical protein EYP85_08020 [Armatimonadetes bacterium]|nr:hypothetical protein [Armatimonadota bacterium]
MIKRYRELIGLPILELRTGENIAKVQDVILNAQERRVLALVVERGGLFKTARAILFERVEGIGDNAVTVETANVIVELPQHPDLERLYKRGIHLQGNRLVTKSGNRLGKIVDFGLETETGEIVLLYLTSGLLKGQTSVNAQKIITVGKDAVIVPDDYAAEPEETTEGEEPS